MIERLEAIEEKYNKLQEELASPDIYNDMDKMKKLSKESSDLSETVTTYHRYKEVIKGIADDKEMLKDPDMADLAKEELAMLEEEKVALEGKLEILLIPKDPND